MSDERKLVFIYNADSGLVNTVKDFWHKALRPSTYQCNLCQTTFGVFGAKKEWKSFIKDLGIESEFLHKDEFLEKYDVKKGIIVHFGDEKVIKKKGRRILYRKIVLS